MNQIASNKKAITFMVYHLICSCFKTSLRIIFLNLLFHEKQINSLYLIIA